ncbi:MAG: PEFG-CTERM sorting domain-containing protein [Nitrosopumilaceae archaeon]
MNIQTSMLIAIFTIATVTGTIPAFGVGEVACPDCEEGDIYEQEKMALQDLLPISIWTNLEVYDHESIVLLEGIVKTPNSDFPVTIVVVSPTNNIVTIDQVMVESDGKFKTTLNTASSLWKKDGTYTIKAQYGGENISDTVTIELTGAVIGGVPIPASCSASEIAARSTLGGQHCIPYTITGGTVTSGTLDIGATSLIVRISGIDDGTITLDIPRSVLDADGDFFVLVGDEEWDIDFDEQTSSSRKLTISFPAGTETIEVIGTSIVPEFGTIAAVILAVAIVSIIALSARTRLRITPTVR